MAVILTLAAMVQVISADLQVGTACTVEVQTPNVQASVTYGICRTNSANLACGNVCVQSPVSGTELVLAPLLGILSGGVRLSDLIAQQQNANGQPIILSCPGSQCCCLIAT